MPIKSKKKRKSHSSFETPEQLAENRRRKRLKGRVIFFLTVISLSLIITLVSWLELSGNFQKFKDNIYSGFIDLTSEAGLNLENTYFSGLEHVDEKLILSMLAENENEKGVIPIFSLPLYDIKTKLEKIGWVKEVNIERQLPSTLHIRIVERIPRAIWQYQKNLRLIDKEGAIITDKKLSEYSKLPVLVGKDAADNASDLFDVMASEPELSSLVVSAIRVGERRWNVRLNNDVEVKLPEIDALAAWQHLAKLQKEKKLLDREVKTIDLRLRDKMYIGTGAE